MSHCLENDSMINKRYETPSPTNEMTLNRTNLYKQLVYIKQIVTQTNSTWMLAWQNHLCSLTKTYKILIYGCITMRQHVVYVLELCLTWVTFDLYVGDGGIHSEFYSQFLSIKLVSVLWSPSFYVWLKVVMRVFLRFFLEKIKF